MRKRVELEEDERNALSEVELYKKSRTMEISSTDVNTPLDGSGLTPLMSACQQSTELDEALERVDVLLAAGANPNLQRDDGNTCLHLAAKFSSAAVVQRLVDQGARFNVKNDVGMTPLAGACRRLDSGAHLIVRILVAAANRMKDYSGVSIAIVVACWYSTYDVLMELRRLSLPGIDPKFTNDNEYSALRVACAYGNGDAVRALLFAFPIKSAKFEYLWVARNRADSLGVLKALYAYSKRYCTEAYEDIEGGATDDAIWAFGHLGLKKGYTRSIQTEYLLQFANYARLGKLDDMGSFLHLAAERGDLGLVQSLMKQNASPFFTDIAKKIPVEVAATEEIRSALMEYMKWKPKREIQQWFGPSFRKRVWTMLLVLKRLQPRIGLVPHDMRKLLVQYVAQMEPVSTPWKRPRSKKK